MTVTTLSNRSGTEPARQARRSDAEMITARVVEAAGSGACEIEHAGGAGRANRAASCVLRPEAGDLVLCAVTDQGLYILAVLERAAATPAVWADAAGGPVALEAPQLSVRAEDVELAARRARIRIDDFGFVGRVARSVVDSAESVARRLTWAADTVLGRAHTYVRNTAGSDIASAGQITRRAEGTLTQQSRHGIMTAKGEMRIDAERIDMG